MKLTVEKQIIDIQHNILEILEQQEKIRQDLNELKKYIDMHINSITGTGVHQY